MIHVDSIARDLSPAISRLDALLVPLAHGGRDGHGQRIGTDPDLRRRLAEDLGAAQVAIARAQQQLTQTSHQANPGNPS